MSVTHQSLFFESASDEPLRVMVEPEACEWSLVRGDRFEVRWHAGSYRQPPTVLWHGQQCVAVFPSTEYEIFLNGQEAFALLSIQQPPSTAAA